MARYLIGIAVIVVLLIAILWQTGERLQKPDFTNAVGADTPVTRIRSEDMDIERARRVNIFAACAESSNDDLFARTEAEWLQQQEQMLRVLGASTDADHLLVAALVSWREHPETALQLLGQAAAIDPRNPLVASQRLELCLTIDSCALAKPELEHNLIAADKANGMAWVQVARSRLQRIDERGALAALSEATATASIDDYFVEYTLLFDRGLAASADLAPFERMISATGISAARFSTAAQVTRDCRERAEHSVEWRDVCLRLGERFEHDSGTMLTQSIGIRMQELMYEYGGDTRAQQLTARRLERLRQRYHSLAGRSSRAGELRDATVFRKYLETFMASNELEALEYLAVEVEARFSALDAGHQPACGSP